MKTAKKPKEKPESTKRKLNGGDLQQKSKPFKKRAKNGVEMPENQNVKVEMVHSTASMSPQNYLEDNNSTASDVYQPPPTLMNHAHLYPHLYQGHPMINPMINPEFYQQRTSFRPFPGSDLTMNPHQTDSNHHPY